MNQDKKLKRVHMVNTQIKTRGIQNPNVIDAMLKVPRHRFVPKTLQAYAYEDRPLEIGYGQTISQPYIVAFMTEALGLNETSVVLEIGTGSGYQAAILSKIGKKVYTIEIVKELAEQAERLFHQLGYVNIYARTGNGYNGWPEVSPFDAIMVTAAAEGIIYNLLDQLKVGGRLIMPVKHNEDYQTLMRITKLDLTNNYKQEELLPVRFVPMTGQMI